jgi:hypothetical protein
VDGDGFPHGDADLSETLGLVGTGPGGDGAGPDQGCLPPVAFDDGEAQPGKAGIHAEHATLEHPFARL